MNEDDSTSKILKSVLRAEKIEDPLVHIPGILAKAKKEYLQKIYKVQDWEDHEDFVGQIARSYGKLLKGGEPNLTATAKMILMDWQRGKIPFFMPPPKQEEVKVEEQMDVEVTAEEMNANMENENKEDKNLKYNINQDIGDLVVGNEFAENKTEEKK